MQPKTDLARQILDGVKTSLGDAWEKNLSDADKIIIADCAADAAGLQLAALVTPAREQDRLAGEKRQIAAQLANISSVGADVARTAFWSTFDLIGERALSGIGIVLKAGLLA